MLPRARNIFTFLLVITTSLPDWFQIGFYVFSQFHDNVMYCWKWIHCWGDVVPSCAKDVEGSLASKLCWIESSPSEKLCVPLEFETRIATATLGT